jgi:hypothetical protein
VSGAVYEEGDVEGGAEPEVEHDQQRDPEALAPENVRHGDGQRQRQQGEQRHVQSALPHDDGVGQQVAHVHLASTLLHFRPRRQHQPADVREPEASPSVVRVCVRLRVLVVHPVVLGPRECVPLRPATKTCNSFL